MRGGVYISYCKICPRKCGVDRSAGEIGFCGAGFFPKIALVSKHLWEEPPISGTKGSGTVFFSHCNLQCVFCQNYKISAEGTGREVSIEQLAEIFLIQQEKGVHNVNLVSPTQYAFQVAAALEIAKNKGLTIPVVYNSNGYESIESLKCLDGLVDIYLPDFKYWSNELAFKYSNVKDYKEVATNTILEMRKQQPFDIFDKDGIMQKGLIIRHLILPNHKEDSFLVLEHIKNIFGTDTYISLMSQYTPMHKAKQIKDIARKLTTFEYQKTVDYFFELGFKNGF